MTHQRHGPHFWQAAATTMSVATLAMVAAFMAPAISASATTTTTSPPTTTTTTTAPTTTTTSVPGSHCYALVSGAPLDRTGWVASSNAPSSSADVPANALDGKLTTRFSTNEHQAPGLFFEVKLASAQTFHALTMASPNSPSDYARGYEVQVSTDNKTWALVANCTGTATPEAVSFPDQTAQYVKVVLTASTPADWWSIDEFNLIGNASTTTTTTPRTTTTTTTTMTGTTTSLSSSANPASVGEAVTYTAKVAPVPGGGTVSFFANGRPRTWLQQGRGRHHDG